MQQKSHNVRWVLAHEPIELFVRAAKVFAEEVNSKAPGQLEIEVLTLSEYAEKYNNGVVVSKHELIDLLDSGRIEMSQTYTITLGKLNKDFFALDLPFLFQDHDHANRVFEGSVGQQLLDSLQTTGKKVKGLAFTYSGGFRIIPGNEEIAKIEDLRGIKVRTSHSPVAIDTFKAVGADVVPMELEELTTGLEQADVAVGESTYPRVYALGQNRVSRVVNHTEHSLFLTSILIAQDFWNSLDQPLQEIVKQAAISAARHERVLSIEDIDNVQKRCEQDGIKVVKLDQTEQDRFREATKGVYKKYENYFTPGLIEQIKKQ
jgi:TRAP-type C4-dicarboxylate transport system substrate-binding protein